MTDKKPWETDWESKWENMYGDSTSDDDQSDDNNDEIIQKDANGNILQAGDTVIAIKDLNGKGVNIKRGDKFKNIRLTDEPGIIESGKLVLKTEFFKKQK
ncbi:MAG: PhnA domain-containing protein [Candidatus Gracilibacteria bacterium]|nr:PhnA domain-containing protein [Candidatus Gracilibacteria bacterium]